MPYHIKNKISKREIRKHGKKMIPVELMKCAHDYQWDREINDNNMQSTLTLICRFCKKTKWDIYHEPS